MKPGLTLPNVAFRPYSANELAALDDLKPSVLIILLYGGMIDQTHMVQLAPYIFVHAPRIIFRPYAGNIPTWEPADWAHECDKRIRAVGLGECIPANEQNLASESGSEDWAAQIAWLKDFAAAWRKLNDRPLHLPALSPSGSWIDGVAAYRAADLDLLFDRIDCHAYGPDAATIAMAVASTLRGPLDVTEFNQIDPGTFFSQIEKGVESATFFLLGGTINQSEYDILKQPAYYQSFKNWKGAKVAGFNVGQGVKDLMAAQGDAPQSDEHYVNDASGQTFKSETFGSKGLYVWSKTSNKTVILPFR